MEAGARGGGGPSARRPPGSSAYRARDTGTSKSTKVAPLCGARSKHTHRWRDTGLEQAASARRLLVWLWLWIWVWVWDMRYRYGNSQLSHSRLARVCGHLRPEAVRFPLLSHTAQRMTLLQCSAGMGGPEEGAEGGRAERRLQSGIDPRAV
jgi:hypothetical protein